MSKWISGRVGLLLVSVVAVVILGVGWLGFVGPERSKVSNLEGQVANTRTQVADAQRLLGGRTLKESLVALHQVQAVMPDQAKMSGILRQLSSIAQTTQVELDTITPQTPTAAALGGEEALPMTVSISGRYFAIQRFLRLLRASADLRNGHLVATGRLYTVDSLQFTGAASGGVITANLTVNGFIYSAASAAAAAATVPAPNLSNTSATAAGQ